MFIVSYIKQTSRDGKELSFLMSYSCRKYFYFGFSLAENNLGMLPAMPELLCEGSVTCLMFFYIYENYFLCVMLVFMEVDQDILPRTFLQIVLAPA